MERRNGFSEILLVGALLVLSFFTGRWTAPQPSVVQVSEVVIDTVHTTSTEETEVIKTVYVPIPQDVDTIAVLQAYYAQKSFVFAYDSNQVKIEGKGIVSMNALDSIRLSVVNYRPTQILRPEYQNALSGGIIAGQGIMAPMIDYRRKNWHFGIGYNLLPNNGSVMFSAKYRFKSW